MEEKMERLEKWKNFLDSKYRVNELKKIDKTLTICVRNAFFGIIISGAIIIGCLITEIMFIIHGFIPSAILFAFMQILSIAITYKTHKKDFVKYTITKEGKLYINNIEFYSGYEMLYVKMDKYEEFTANVNESRTQYVLEIKSNDNYNYIRLSTINFDQVMELLSWFVFD